MPKTAKERVLVKEAPESEVSQEKASHEKVVDKQGRSYATGKRKNAAARVWIKKGTGKITVNDRDAKIYFGREILISMINAPLATTKNLNKFDVIATISGGGKSGQAGALAHGISKALVSFDQNTHKTLRSNGFLTRDSRVVERKKYGLKKARKAQTYRKR